MQMTNFFFSFPQILKYSTWSIGPIGPYMRNVQRLRSDGCCCCWLLLPSSRQRRSSINPPLKILLWSWWARRPEIIPCSQSPHSVHDHSAPPLTLICIPCMPTQFGSRPGTLGAFGAEAGPAQQKRQCPAWSWQWQGRTAQMQCAERRKFISSPLTWCCLAQGIELVTSVTSKAYFIHFITLFEDPRIT